jgi:hypothetical protein
MVPLQPPDEKNLPNGWNVQGWFQLQADALTNHKKGQSRSLEHVKPVGQVLIRMIIRGNPNLKRQAKLDAEEGAEEDGDAEALALNEEYKNLDPADEKQKGELEKRRKKMERKMRGAVERAGSETVETDGEAEVYATRGSVSGDELTGGGSERCERSRRGRSVWSSSCSNANAQKYRLAVLVSGLVRGD